MRIKSIKVPFIIFVIIVGAIVLQIDNVTEIIKPGYPDLPIDENINLSISEDSKLYIMNDTMYENFQFEFRNYGTVTNLELSAYEFGAGYKTFFSYNFSVINTETGDYYHFDDMPENSSVYINDTFAVGKLELDAGNYDISFTQTQGDSIDITYSFADTSLFLDIAIIVFLSIVIIVGFVFMIITYLAYRRFRNSDYDEYSGTSTYKSNYSNKLNKDYYENDDDPFADY